MESCKKYSVLVWQSLSAVKSLYFLKGCFKLDETSLKEDAYYLESCRPEYEN